MDEIVYINNIKEKILPNLKESDVDAYIKSLADSFKTHSDHIWYDLKYLNTLLELYFIYYSKIKEPKAFFYALIFKNLPYKILDKLIENDKQLRNKVSCLLNDTYLLNDLGITENDYDLLNSILLYAQYIEVPVPAGKLYSGISYDIEKGLSFKFKRTSR